MINESLVPRQDRIFSKPSESKERHQPMRNGLWHLRTNWCYLYLRNGIHRQFRERERIKIVRTMRHCTRTTSENMRLTCKPMIHQSVDSQHLVKWWRVKIVRYHKIESIFTRENLPSKVKLTSQMVLGSYSLLFYLERLGGIICFSSLRFNSRLTHECDGIVTLTVWWQKRYKLLAEMLKQLTIATLKVDAPEKLCNFNETVGPRVCFQTINETWRAVISAVRISDS